MADFWTHIHYGTNILNKSKLSIQPDAFYNLACQGPDIFFYNKNKSINKLGSLLHNKKCIETIKHLLIQSKENNFDKKYTLGWISHYILDSTIHPFIDNLGAKYTHKKVEVALDYYYLRTRKLTELSYSLSSSYLEMSTDHITLMEDIYLFIFKKVYTTDVAVFDFRKSFDRILLLHKLFYKSSPVVKKILKIILKIFDRKALDYFYDTPADHIPEININYFEQLIKIAFDLGVLIFNRIDSFYKDQLPLKDVIDLFPKTDYSGRPIDTKI